MRIRKSIADLTDEEASEFVKALIRLKVKIANPSAPATQQITTYDRFVSLHGAVMSVTAPRNPAAINMGHWYPGFLPWHREMLIRVERELNRVAPAGVDIAIPYWPWSDAAATIRMLQDDRFGNTPPGTGYMPVTTGYFAQTAPPEKNRPEWWPTSAKGWHVRNELQTEIVSRGYENSIYRQVRGVKYLPDAVKDIEFGLNLPNYHRFWRWVEEGRATHNSMHSWVGGTLSNNRFSPMDPIFLLNHANVDRLWSRWQDRGHQGVAHYPAEDDWAGQPPVQPGEQPRRTIPIGHRLNDLMWPWVGDASGYSTRMGDELNLPHLKEWVGDYSTQAPRRPIDVLDTTKTGEPTEGYIYQEPVVRFPAVQKVLNIAISNWNAVNRRDPVFSGHGRNFGWESAQQLCNSRPQGQQLVQDNLVGVGRAEETNIVRVLRHGLPGFGPRMPKNGPYLSSPEIGLIAKWINDGCHP